MNTFLQMKQFSMFVLKTLPVMGTKSSYLTQHKYMMVRQNESFTDFDFAVTQYLSA